MLAEVVHNILYKLLNIYNITFYRSPFDFPNSFMCYFFCFFISIGQSHWPQKGFSAFFFFLKEATLGFLILSVTYSFFILLILAFTFIIFL